MSKPRRIAMAIALLAGLVMLLRPCWLSSPSGRSKPEDAASRGKALRDHGRTHRDVNRLARALSMAAAEAIGLVRVRGQVLDRQSGEPIANAEVIFTGPSGENSARCDAEGRYELELLPGFYRSYAQADNFIAVAPHGNERLPDDNLKRMVAMPRATLAPLAGLFRDHSAVNLHLVQGATLRVHVVNSDGQAISGAIVAAESKWLIQVISGSNVGESDTSGGLLLRVPTGPITFRAQHDDYAGTDPSVELRLRAGEERDLSIVLLRGCIISGQVRYRNGTAAFEGALEKRLWEGRYEPIAKIEKGRFRYTQVRDGELTLRAWPWKSPPTEDYSYDCEPGARFPNEVLMVPDTKPVLSGSVSDEAGNAVPFAYVDVFPLQRGQPGQMERADGKGEFEFYDLRPGPHQLSVYEAGKGAVVQLIEVPSSGVPLRISGTGAVLGSVDWIEHGTVTMRYRCTFRLDEEEEAKSDTFSMPMQRTLVLVKNHKFRVDAVPACPIQGRLTDGEHRQSFSATVVRDNDTVLTFD